MSPIQHGSKPPIPKGPASLILEPFRDWIIATVCAYWNQAIKLKYLAPDGVSTITADAKFSMSADGSVAMLDLATGNTPLRSADSSWPPTIYSKTETYDAGAWAWVKTSDTITTAGVTDPDTGLTVLSKAGLWRCLKAAAPVTNPGGLPAGTYYHIPQGPYPTPDDPTASNMFWMYFGNVYCA